MFVDASVIVACLADEAEARGFASKLAEAKIRYTSGLCVAEAAVRLSVMLDLDAMLVETSIQSLLDEAEILVVPVSASIASKAVAAFAAYGRGGTHPAQLTLADCLSYACAKAYRVPLLFKSNSLALTDIRIS